MSTSADRTRSAHRGSRRERWSTLVPVGILVVGLLELAGLAILGHFTSIWWVLGVVLVGWVVGLALLVAAGQQSFVRLRSLVRAVRGRGDISDHMSRPAFTLLAAICFVFPGMLTDVAALILLIVPVQKRVARSVGLSGGDGTRGVLYRRTGPGVIEGEIVVEAQPTRSGSSAEHGSGETPPPILTQS